MKSTKTPVSIHDFTEKLRQPALSSAVLDYVAWRQAVGKAQAKGEDPPEMPGLGPFSINLDLTTACNYACGHCIDWDSLNMPVRHDSQELLNTLATMHERGLRSVILIGGGEPTLFPGFVEVVGFLKERDIQVAIVSNGSRNEVIEEIAPLLTKKDWVRLSLDSGTEETFAAMHRPKAKDTTLRGICQSAQLIKQANPDISLGFSFVITWKGARRGDEFVLENICEMETATQLAKEFGFDYISFKPFLLRAPQGAEVMDPLAAEDAHEEMLEKVKVGLTAAKLAAGGALDVVESTNLKVLLDGSWKEYTHQPKVCHMQAFRQVVSPLGVFNCPAHRGVEKAKLPQAGVAPLLDSFDASHECREVTCLYHSVNHWLDGLVKNGVDAESWTEGAALDDYFL